MTSLASTVDLKFVSLVEGRSDCVALLTLNRPAVSNAFNDVMIQEMLVNFEAIERKGLACRAVVIRGAGKNFSGGADLEWMQKSANLSYEENLRDAETLSALFQRLYALPAPTIAVVNGAAFGGAVGLVACCDFAIAIEGAKFCLSEVKVGLVAAVILPYLSIRVMPGHLRRFVMTGMVFGAEAALSSGLVQRVVQADAVDACLREELSQILMGEPTIQRTFKKNHRRLLEGTASEWAGHQSVGVETIAKARVSATGQAGIRAFLSKQAPEWVIPLPPDWKLA